MTGASGLFGVALRPVAEDRFVAFIDGLQLFGRGYSWGGFESLLIPVFPERTVVPLPFEGPLFRIAAGLEDSGRPDRRSRDRVCPAARHCLKRSPPLASTGRVWLCNSPELSRRE